MWEPSTCLLYTSFSLWSVKSHLISCVSVNCAHDTRLDRCKIVQSLSHWCKTVCCTRSCRNNCIFWLKYVMVYIVYDCRKVISCWCRDNNFSSSCLDVSRCFFFRCVESCTLQNYVNADFSPRKFCCVCFCVDFNFFSINDCLLYTSRCV